MTSLKRIGAGPEPTAPRHGGPIENREHKGRTEAHLSLNSSCIPVSRDPEGREKMAAADLTKRRRLSREGVPTSKDSWFPLVRLERGFQEFAETGPAYEFPTLGVDRLALGLPA